MCVLYCERSCTPVLSACCACQCYKLCDRGRQAVALHYTEFQAIFPWNFNDPPETLVESVTLARDRMTLRKLVWSFHGYRPSAMKIENDVWASARNVNRSTVCVSCDKHVLNIQINDRLGHCRASANLVRSSIMALLLSCINIFLPCTPFLSIVLHDYASMSLLSL